MKKAYVQSIFFQEEHKTLREVIGEFENRSIRLIFDTNLCIYLRSLYLDPKETVNRLKSNGIWTALEELIFLINYYELDYDFISALDESCRNKEDYSLNYAKAIQSVIAIDSVLSYDYVTLKSFIDRDISIPPIKDETDLKNAKAKYFESDTIFRGPQSINYPALLKIYIIDSDNSKSDYEKMIEFLEFYDEKLDIVSPNLVKFAYMYFGRNSSIKNMLHPKKKNKEKILHAIWNCATDISIYHLSNKMIEESNRIPVFITFDEGLYNLNKSSKMKVMFTEGSSFNSVIPPLVETDFSLPTKWEEREYNGIFDKMEKIHSKVQSIERMLKFDPEKRIEKLIILVPELEDQLNPPR